MPREDYRCPECLSDQLKKCGFIVTGGESKQYWNCKACGRYTTKPIDLAKVSLKFIGGPVAVG